METPRELLCCNTSVFSFLSQGAVQHSSQMSALKFCFFFFCPIKHGCLQDAVLILAHGSSFVILTASCQGAERSWLTAHCQDHVCRTFPQQQQQQQH